MHHGPPQYIAALDELFWISYFDNQHLLPVYLVNFSAGNLAPGNKAGSQAAGIINDACAVKYQAGLFVEELPDAENAGQAEKHHAGDANAMDKKRIINRQFLHRRRIHAEKPIAHGNEAERTQNHQYHLAFA